MLKEASLNAGLFKRRRKMRDWQPFAGLPLWFWLFILPTFLALFCLFYPAKAKRLMSPIWAILDRVYLGFGILSAIFMVIILILTILNIELKALIPIRLLTLAQSSTLLILIQKIPISEVM